MANLQFLSNVTHAGRNFRGPVVKDNIVQQNGMIVDLGNDTTGLREVAQGLIDRKLARETSDPATHTTLVVGPDQFVLPVNAPSGSGQAPAAAQAVQQQPDGFPQHPAPQVAQPQPQPQAQAPVQSQPSQPTPEQVAALAATQN